MRDFEWLIIDDGSTDNTSDLIALFKQKANFPIIYTQKENGGKHTAYNLALELAHGDLLFTVDSDDWLPCDSLEIIASKLSEIYKSDDIAGLIALKKYPTGKIIGNTFPAGLKPASVYELEHSGNGGERSIILKTEVARKFPFPCITKENFMGECIVYDAIGLKFKFTISNSILTICEYQADGLSSNPYKLMISNPGGYMYYYRNRIDMAESIPERINYILRYNAFRYLYKPDSISELYSGSHKILNKILSPLSAIVAKIYKSKSV